MAKRNLPKRLFKSQDRISSYQTNTSSTKLMKRVSRDHVDVLQNIEAILVNHHRDDPNVDDRVITTALRACQSGATPTEPLVAEIVGDLAAIREFRTDVSDTVWQDALRVVDDSVRLHSSLKPGEKSYLNFVSPYVK